MDLNENEILIAMGSRIREKREVLKMSQDELAQKLGYKSRSSINKIELGITGIPQRKLKLLANFLKTSPQYLLEGFEPDLKAKDIFSLDNIFPLPKTKAIPILEPAVFNGPIQANEEFLNIDNKIKADFYLKAQGNSMSTAGIKDGSIVFCHRQDIVENGEIVALLIRNEVMLKRFYYYRENDLVILRSDNLEYKDLVYSKSQINEIFILGKAVAVQTILD